MPAFMGLGTPFGFPHYNPFMLNPMTSGVFTNFTSRPPIFNGKHIDKVFTYQFLNLFSIEIKRIRLSVLAETFEF
jgi:hypothetical protein